MGRPGRSSSATLCRFIDHERTSYTKHVLLMVLWNTCQLIASIRVNGIYATSFCPRKTNDRSLFITGCFQRQRRRVNDATVTSSVVMMKLTAMCGVFMIFQILKISKVTLFCCLFMERYCNLGFLFRQCIWQNAEFRDGKTSDEILTMIRKWLPVGVSYTT